MPAIDSIDLSLRLQRKIAATLLVTIVPSAFAQTISCTGTSPVCTIPAGSYASSLSHIDNSQNALSITNSGTFGVSQPASQALGYYLLLLGSIGNNAPFAASNANAPAGGNGGPQDDASLDGGTAGHGGGITLTNSAPITTNVIGSIGYGGSALEALAYGGSGGNVQSTGTDGNGNPKYDGGSGGAGGAGNAATLINTGAIEAGRGLAGSAGYRGLAALSMGGNGGLGSTGQPGGSAGPVTITNSASVNLNWQWSGTLPTSTFPGPYPRPQPNGVWGILGLSSSGNGSYSVTSRSNGGSGSGSGVVAINVDPGGDITIANTGTANAAGAGIGAMSIGGDGGTGYDKSVGGAGGFVPSTSTAPAIAVSVNAAGVHVSGDQMSGILAQATGGKGGAGGAGQDNSDGGNGGSVGDHTTLGVNVTLTNASVSTSGTKGAGIVATVAGGTAGDGTSYNNEAAIGSNSQSCGATDSFSRSGCGGGGGNASAVTIGLGGTSSKGSTQGNSSPGIVAVAQGGLGGNGGELTALKGTVGNGGSGGQAAPVTITLNPGSSVTTTGNAGASAGSASDGIVAASRGGAGGSGGEAGHDLSSLSGSGGGGGAAYDVSVTNYHGASITTSGSNAAAIVAQSLGGSGGASGTVGTVTVVNQGSLQTAGTWSHGILAQAIGGGGGAAGASGSGIITSLGGNGALAANGGTVSIMQTQGSITTAGESAFGILAQAIGGGGGDGGGASGVIAVVGGTAGGGGAGGPVSVESAWFSVATSGIQAHGIVAQSIGGGGGNGGDAKSTSTVISYAVGGSGGSGGAGGTATVNLDTGSITLQGTRATAIGVQSIGGGGGTGGAGYALAAGTNFDIAAAIGATGGNGGAGGAASAYIGNTIINTGQFGTPSQPTNLVPIDAFGIVVQSIGGGGGIGGSASAQALSVAPVSPESTSFNFSLSESVGGLGGSGGNGGPVNVALTGGTAVTTQGQGSHGLIAASIGGGGGNGGDSSAMAATLQYGRSATLASAQGLSIDLAVGVGGAAGGAGSGGTGVAEIGGRNGVKSGTASITTFGDYADGVLAHSLGGGGGNGGVGSSSTEDFGATRNLHLLLAVGGGGGAGNVGGSTTVTLYPQSTITTYGASAMGIVAQSVGGGGGASQGSTLNLGASYGIGGGATVTPAGTVNVNVGGASVQGANGGTTTVDVQGTVLTNGGDATGVLAQSVGGGGGVGGSAGAEASADNWVSVSTRAREFVSNAIEKNVAWNAAQLGFALGGRGGGGGAGGPVNVSLSGAIATLGDWAQGIVAQSIGGGGGKAGTATSNQGLSTATLNGSVGGSGGSGGDGGAVTVTLQGGTIVTGQTANGVTSGYGAFGILAQSIGGGGGVGADGSASSIGIFGIGGGHGGNGGASGNGGSVTLSGATDSGIGTNGEQAHGIVLQSIGGGGGTGGTGNSSTLAIFGGRTGSASLDVGGTNGSSGNGGAVKVDNAAVGITTSGANATGLLAQSIGGGGGLGLAPSTATITSTTITAGGGADGNGGAVTINLPASSSINTHGIGAHGIVAQSIGGGGGIAGMPDTTTTTPTFAIVPRQAYSYGASGPVSIDIGGRVTVGGDAAFGVIAQSIGAGGGLTASGSNVTASIPNGYYGGSVAVTLDANATLSASGNSSVGIFAQTSLGYAPAPATIAVTIGGSLSCQGFACVWIDAGQTNTLTINPSGSVNASNNAWAAYYTTEVGVQYGIDVVNQGTLTGAVSLGKGQLSNAQGATWVTGGSSRTNVANVVNDGTLVVAGAGKFDRATIVGDFTQHASGTLVVDADFDGRRSDQLAIQGNATLAGALKPALTTVKPGVALPVVMATGTLSGTLIAAPSALFDWELRPAENQLLLSAKAAHFASPSLGLQSNVRSVAEHLQAIWDQGGAPPFDTLFATLETRADSAATNYASDLAQLSPGATVALAANSAAESLSFANASLSCPYFQGSGTWLVEGSCAFARAIRRNTTQDGSGGISGFDTGWTTYQIGGQTEAAPNWFVGGSFGWGSGSITSDDGRSKASGDDILGALTFKYQAGPWLLSGAAYGGTGNYDTRRTIAVPGFESVATASPDAWTAGVLGRATYTLGYERFYLRPSFTLSATHVHGDGYQEGGGQLALAVAAKSQTNVVATPAVEVGGRLDFDDGIVLRPYASAGASFRSQDSWCRDAHFVNAPAGSRSFTTCVDVGSVAGVVTAGLQLVQGMNVDVRVQYEGMFSDHMRSNAGGVTAAWRF